jgi:hypothetical protein
MCKDGRDLALRSTLTKIWWSPLRDEEMQRLTPTATVEKQLWASYEDPLEEVYGALPMAFGARALNTTSVQVASLGGVGNNSRRGERGKSRVSPSWGPGKGGTIVQLTIPLSKVLLDTSFLRCAFVPKIDSGLQYQPPFPKDWQSSMWPLEGTVNRFPFRCGPTPPKANMCNHVGDKVRHCSVSIWVSSDGGVSWQDFGLGFTYSGDPIFNSATPPAALLGISPGLIMLRGLYFPPSPDMKCAFRKDEGSAAGVDSISWLYTSALFMNDTTAMCPTPDPQLLGISPSSGLLAISVDGQQLSSTLPFTFSAALEFQPGSVVAETPRIGKGETLEFSVTGYLETPGASHDSLLGRTLSCRVAAPNTPAARN